MLADVKFARRVAQSAYDKNQRGLRPGDVLLAARNYVFKQFVELQFADQLQCEPRSAELKLIFDANVRRVDLAPLGLGFVAMIEELQLRISRLLIALCCSFYAGPPDVGSAIGGNACSTV